ncbi:MAG TPA: VWA domain-containing protein [Chloroflexia bacterium]|nr:VWA domain-containing protein [Chloroflexia bacterium]
MSANISLKATWNHDPLPAAEQTSLGYLLVDVTQPDAPIQPAVPVENQVLNLNLVLDTSGSMAGAKLQNLKKAVAWVIDNLSARDTLSITLFDDEVHPLVPATHVEDRDALRAQIDAIREAGGTAMSKGLTVGLQEARNAPAPGAVSRIVVLTDGQTWGDGDVCVELARQAGDAGIPITCLGVGAEEDWSIELLDAIARESGGEVGYIEKPEEIEQAFASTMRRMQSTLARNLRVTFTPAAGVSARAVYRVAPLISRLWPAMDDASSSEAGASAEPQTGGTATSLSLPLGDLQSADGQTLLFEVVLPPRRPGSYRLARLLLEYETGDPANPKGDTALDIVADFTAAPVTGPGNARVMNSVEKATTFKLQTRALQASMVGDNAAATRNLRAAATRLLNLGETELAQAAEREAERIESEGKASPAATKKLTFDTRKLSVSETVHLKEE